MTQQIIAFAWSDSMREVFTLNRTTFRTGMLHLPVFVAMLVASLLYTYPDVPVENRSFLKLLGIAVPFTMTVMSVWMLLLYARASITLDDGEACFTHVLGRRTIALSEVVRARWHEQPGLLTLFLPGGRQAVQFGDFRASQRERLILHFRRHLAPEIQEGWSESWERYAAEEGSGEALADYDRLVRSMWRFIVAGTVAGLPCWLAVHLYADYMGVVSPTWTGSLLFDWLAIGALTGMGVVAYVRLLAWLHRPDD